jgi:hypothetical protein
MSTPNKPAEKGYKPGANMQHGDYDPKKEGMQVSGNHASGHPANDPGSNPHEQKQDPQVQPQNQDTEHDRQQGNLARTDLHNKQSAATASAEATRRDRSAGARGDNSTDVNRDSKR